MEERQKWVALRTNSLIPVEAEVGYDYAWDTTTKKRLTPACCLRDAIFPESLFLP